MEASAIASASGASATTDRGLSSLKSEDFFKILVTEMQQQDPLAPNDTKDMIGQVSQIRSIELSDKLNGTLKTLALQQKASDAGGMVGKYVQAAVTDDEGTETNIEGVVMAVRFESDGSTVLELDTGQAVRMEDVQHVTTLAALESALGAPSTPAADATQDASGGAKDGQTEKASWFDPSSWF